MVCSFIQKVNEGVAVYIAYSCGQLAPIVNDFVASGVPFPIHCSAVSMQEVGEKHITLNDGTVVPYGLLVWSTGVGPSRFVKSLSFEKAPQGRLAVDERLKVVRKSAGRSFNVNYSCTKMKAWFSKCKA